MARLAKCNARAAPGKDRRRKRLSYRVACGFASLLPAAATAAAAAEPPRDARVVAEDRVEAIIDGDTLRLAGGFELRLTGIQAPKLPLGRPHVAKWPLADEAKAALAELTLGATVRLRYGGRRIDRHGRLLAHLFDPRGRWIQGEMLSRGLARVYTFADNRTRAAEMLALERAARAAGRGIWAHPHYRIRDAADAVGLSRLAGTFQIVEGQVRDAALVRRRLYLNFGADWRTDFTVTAAPRHRRSFAAEGDPVARYQGRRVRVRGWLKRFNGPMIEADHPERIELLDR